MLWWDNRHSANRQERKERKMKKILPASLVAMMAVSAANADIASTDFVIDRTGNTSLIAEGLGDNLTSAVNKLNDNMSDGTLTIADGAVDTDQLADGAVTTPKIDNGAVTDEKIESVSMGKVDGLEGALEARVALEQGDDHANKTMVTDDTGTVVAGSITKDSTNGQFVTGVSVSNGNVVLATKDLASGDVTDALGYTPEDVANKVTAYDAEAEDGVKDSKYTSVTAAEEIASTFANAAVQQLGIANYATKTELNTTIEGLTNTVEAADNKVVVGVVQNNGKVTSVTSSEVTKAMLASNVQTSLGLADSALQNFDDILNASTANATNQGTYTLTLKVAQDGTKSFLWEQIGR